jgi:hypothetical protein
MMGKTTARSGRVWRVLGVAVASAVAFAVAPAPGGAAARAAAPALKWKFTPGEALHYQMDQKTITQLKAGNGQESKTTVTQTLDATWAVKSVDASGTAEMTQSIDRLRTKIESPFGSIEYDSKADKQPEGPIAAGVVPMLKALVGAKFQYKMSPQGELSEVQVPEGLVKALKEAGPSAGMFSEDGLKNMIHDSSLVLPSQDLDKPWTRQSKIPQPPIGTLVLDKSYRYDGTDKDRHAEKIVMEVKVSLEPMPNSNFDFKLGDQAGKGVFLFDAKAGRVVSSNVNQKMSMGINLPNQKIEQSTDTSTTMTLLEAKAGDSK